MVPRYEPPTTARVRAPAVAAVRGPVPAPAPAPAQPVERTDPLGPVGVLGQIVDAAVDGVARVVRTEAAVAVAAQFTFPLALALAVFVFLLVQNQVDRRDPKLRIAPQHVIETLLTFRTEDEL